MPTHQGDPHSTAQAGVGILPFSTVSILTVNSRTRKHSLRVGMQILWAQSDSEWGQGTTSHLAALSHIVEGQ